jgi:hypothetical protein
VTLGAGRWALGAGRWALGAGKETYARIVATPNAQRLTPNPQRPLYGFAITPASTVTPVRLIAWKNSSRPETSISMK